VLEALEQILERSTVSTGFPLKVASVPTAFRHHLLSFPFRPFWARGAFGRFEPSPPRFLEGPLQRQQAAVGWRERHETQAVKGNPQVRQKGLAMGPG